LTLPGYFRPTKLWDLLVINKGERLIAASNSRAMSGRRSETTSTTEPKKLSAIHWTSGRRYREGAFASIQTVCAWMMLVEDAPGSQFARPGQVSALPRLSEFQGASYLKRYDILCQKLVQQQLYTTAVVITLPDSRQDAEYGELSEMTSLKTLSPPLRDTSPLKRRGPPTYTTRIHPRSEGRDSHPVGRASSQGGEARSKLPEQLMEEAKGLAVAPLKSALPPVTSHRTICHPASWN